MEVVKDLQNTKTRPRSCHLTLGSSGEGIINSIFTSSDLTWTPSSPCRVKAEMCWVAVLTVLTVAVQTLQTRVMTSSGKPSITPPLPSTLVNSHRLSQHSIGTFNWYARVKRCSNMAAHYGKGKSQSQFHSHSVHMASLFARLVS